MSLQRKQIIADWVPYLGRETARTGKKGDGGGGGRARSGPWPVFGSARRVTLGQAPREANIEETGRTERTGRVE